MSQMKFIAHCFFPQLVVEEAAYSMHYGGKKQNYDSLIVCSHRYTSCWKFFSQNELPFTPHLVPYYMRKERGLPHFDSR